MQAWQRAPPKCSPFVMHNWLLGAQRAKGRRKVCVFLCEVCALSDSTSCRTLRKSFCAKVFLCLLYILSAFSFFALAPPPPPPPPPPLAYSQSLIHSPRFADSIQILRYFSNRLLPQNECRTEEGFFFLLLFGSFLFFLKFFLSEEQPVWKSCSQGGGVGYRRSGEANTASLLQP